MEVRNRHLDEEAVLKVASTERARVTRSAATWTVSGTPGSSPPPSVREVLPEPVGSDAESSSWSLDRRAGGVDARTVVGDHPVLAALSRDVVDRVAALHRATGTHGRARRGPSRRSSASRSGRPTRCPAPRLRLRADETSLARLQAELRADLAGRTVTAGFVHGNLWLGNVRCRPEDGRVTALVGWERSRVDLPALEVMHLVCTTRANRRAL